MLFTQPLQTMHNEPPRRWIGDEFFDLIVWYRRDEAIDGFQLCYDKPGRERALTWMSSGNASHNAIDTGEADPRKNRTPILVADGVFPAVRVWSEFARRSAKLDPGLRELVLDKILEYSRR